MAQAAFLARLWKCWQGDIEQWQAGNRLMLLHSAVSAAWFQSHRTAIVTILLDVLSITTRTGTALPEGVP